MTVPTYIPISSIHGFPFSPHLCQHLSFSVCVSVFCNHSKWHEVISHCDLHLYFLIISYVEHLYISYVKWSFSSVQLLSRVQLIVIPWTAACQASLSITNSQSLLKLMCIEMVMPSNPLVLCRPLILPPTIFPSISIFSNESVLHIRWPKDWSFSISPSMSIQG